MDKPKSLSVKDFLIRKMSVKMLKSESILDSIVSHQFSSAQQAMRIHNSIELSGFGKFLFNVPKATKKLKKFYEVEKVYTNILNNEDIPEKKIHKTQIKLKTIQDYILSLKPKINEPV